MPRRVAAALPFLQEQLTSDRFAYFAAFRDDPQLFCVEVLAAYADGEFELPDDIRRMLGARLNQPLGSGDGLDDDSAGLYVETT